MPNTFQRPYGSIPDTIIEVEDLRAWLATKSPMGEYTYTACRQCLIAQFLREVHLLEVECVVPFYYDIGKGDDRVSYRFSNDIEYIVAPHNPLHIISTYGQALQRLQKKFPK